MFGLYREVLHLIFRKAKNLTINQLSIMYYNTKLFINPGFLFLNISRKAFSAYPKIYSFSRTLITQKTIILQCTSAYIILIPLSIIFSKLKSPILNETALDVNTSDKITLSYNEDYMQQKHIHFNGILNYKQLCSGSIMGMLLGIFVAKISNTLLFTVIFGSLNLYWLQNRGIISKTFYKHFFKGILNIEWQNIRWNTLLLDDLSFKLSFFMTFALTSINI